MRNASTEMLEQGTQNAVPAPDPIPAEIERQNLTRISHSKRTTNEGTSKWTALGQH